MEILNSFLGQGMVAQIGEIVLFANTVTMAMPTRWRGNIVGYFIAQDPAPITHYMCMLARGPLSHANELAGLRTGCNL